MKNRSGKRDRPQKGSLRVQGWIYAVLNPLVDGLLRERAFLESGNLTWRFYNQNFEFMLPVAGYVGPGARHTLEDFLKANLTERKVIGRHDALLDQLRVQAREVYEALCANDVFLARVRQKLEQFESGPPSRTYPGGAIPREQFPRLVAERVLNNVSEVPHHHTDKEFWQETSVFFKSFRSEPAFQKLEPAIVSLRECDARLIDHLNDVRYRFCGKYDLPADPLPSMSYVAEHPSLF